MIKLVVSDLDGTLLMKGEEALKKEVFDMLHLLREKEILFAVASGRSYEELKGFFGRASYDMIFICENGALVLYQGKVILKTPISGKIGNAFLRELLHQSDYEWLAAGVHTCYTSSRTRDFLSMLKEKGIHPMQVNGPSDIPEESLRISVYHPGDTVFQKWSDSLQVSYEGKEWLDFTQKGVNKGSALEEVKKLFLKEGEEILAFGDGENDRKMLEMAERAYLVKKNGLNSL